MKGLIACFVIVCLSLAAGVPTDEESKVIFKSFNYPDKEVIYCVDPFWKDEMVYAVCDGSGADKMCKVYVESANQDTVRSCDLNLTYTGTFYRHVELYNGGNSKAVFAVSGDNSRLTKLISVNFDGCEIKKTGVVVSKSFPNSGPYFTKVFIVPHHNTNNSNYDVFFHNTLFCQNYLCKVTFDYKGNVVKGALRFPGRDSNFYRYDIKYVNSAYLVSKTSNEEFCDIYLIHNADKLSRTRYNLIQDNGTGGTVGVSSEENKISYCLYYRNRTLSCGKYDEEDKTTKTQVKLSMGEGRIEFVDVLMLVKGLLTLSVTRNLDNNDREIFVVHHNEEGKEGKYVKLDLKCNESNYVLPKLYKNTDGKYCATSMCFFPIDSSNYRTKFSRSTRCFHEAELF